MAICACHDSPHALPCLSEDGQSVEAAGSSPHAVYGLSLHQRQFIALTRAVLASALNGSRVLVVEVRMTQKAAHTLLLRRVPLHKCACDLAVCH